MERLIFSHVYPRNGILHKQQIAPQLKSPHICIRNIKRKQPNVGIFQTAKVELISILVHNCLILYQVKLSFVSRVVAMLMNTLSVKGTEHDKKQTMRNRKKINSSTEQHPFMDIK